VRDVKNVVWQNCYRPKALLQHAVLSTMHKESDLENIGRAFHFTLSRVSFLAACQIARQNAILLTKSARL